LQVFQLRLHSHAHVGGNIALDKNMQLQEHMYN
jgi:hypothetical protein